jgi:predicted kinase
MGGPSRRTELDKDGALVRAYAKPQGQLVIVMMAGLPGTGKSTLACALAARVGGMVLDKDVIRASVFPQRLIKYSTEQDDFVVGLMLNTAEYLLRGNPAAIVILDGRPFSRKYQVTHIVERAKQIGTPWRIVECVCSERLALQRLEKDIAKQRHVAKNRNAELYREVKERFEEIRRPKLVVRTSLRVETCAKRVEEYLKLE